MEFSTGNGEKGHRFEGGDVRSCAVHRMGMAGFLEPFGVFYPVHAARIITRPPTLQPNDLGHTGCRADVKNSGFSGATHPTETMA